MDRPQCRICLESGGNLFSPCRCNGSVKYVHQECLETWLETTTNAESKIKCITCDTEYLIKPPPKYPFYYFCHGMAHNGFILFCFNFSLSLLLSITFDVTVHSEVTSTTIIVKTPMTCFGLLSLELMYACVLPCIYAVPCVPICTKSLQLFSPHVMLLVCGIPVSISVIDSTPGMFVFTCFFAILLLSTIVTFFVQHVDKHMKTNYKQRILPRPEETEEKNEIVIDNPMNTEKESIDAYSELEESDIDLDLEMIDV